MKNRYRINMLYICPFVFLSGINIMPDLNYPPRLCVIDKEEGFAIDIENNLKYDFLESSSRLYVKSMADKIKDNRRVAFPATFCFNTMEDGYKKGLKIIEDLKVGKNFLDGNEVLTNEEYLQLIEQGEIKKTNNEKTKKISLFKKSVE